MKNVLIEDYIKLLCINKKYFTNSNTLYNDTNIFFNTKNLLEKTIDIYEILLNKFKLNDLSISILKKEINSVNPIQTNLSEITLSYVYNEILGFLSGSIKKFSKSTEIKNKILSTI